MKGGGVRANDPYIGFYNSALEASDLGSILGQFWGLLKVVLRFVMESFF